MKLIIEIVFSADEMSARRRAEIQRLVQDLKDELEPFGGKVVRAAL